MEVDEEDLYLKINCKGKRPVRKANKGINRKNNNRFKNLKIKKRRKLYRTAKAQCRCRGL